MSKSTYPPARRGAAAILILVLTSVLFIAVVFSVDVARIQLAQLELQSAADLTSRAGAEAMSRGVGDPDDMAATDMAIRNEIDMVAQLNSVAGSSLIIDSTNDVTFGHGVRNPTNDTVEFVPSPMGNVNEFSNSVMVTPTVPSFPVIFGAFVKRTDVGLGEVASAMIAERDICVVLDRSTSMLTFDAGYIEISDFDANLAQLEDDLYNSTERFYPSTEFKKIGTRYKLSRMQALKLAVMKFREEIDNSRGHEQLGLTTYSNNADDPSGGHIASSPMFSFSGIDIIQSNILIGSGATTGREVYASALEAHTTGYINFDMNYLGMRRKGSTNIVAGIEKGVEILYGPGRRLAATPVLIIMTDGRHNASGDPVATAAAAKTAHPELQIYTVTFGSGAYQTPMKNIANVGGGEHHHAVNVTDLILVFRDLANSAGVTLIK